MLDKKLKRKWCAALRGGKWRQIKKNYHDDTEDGRCCLGVLGEIIGGRPGCYCVLLNEHLEDTLQGRLARYNDEQGKSFSEIADWIEENL